MGKIDYEVVARAYSAAWSETGDLDVAYEAAATAFRKSHPEITDPAIVACLVAITISGVIGDNLGTWAKPAHQANGFTAE